MASNATIAATQRYLEVWTTSLFEISSRKTLLKAKLVGMDAISSARERLGFLKYCAGVTLDPDQPLVDATISTRDDLEMAFDSNLYFTQTSEMMVRIREAMNVTFDDFQSTLSDQSQVQLRT